MASPWQAWVEVLPDLSKFDKKANAGITNSLGSAGTAGSSIFGKNFLSGVGQVFGGTALTQLAFGAGRVIGDAISTAVNFGLDGIQLASSLGEQANAVKVAFGPVSDEILALAEKAPQKLNLTRSAFDKLSVRFSSFAKTIAGNGGNVSKVIDDLTQRGADFASVYDLEVGNALELFQSGLAGETEPLRAFGIDLSEASVKAFAYANGIAEQGKQLTEAEKVQARYQSLLAQTNLVTGDLANTSGSLANQQRQLAVGVEEAQTKLGEALLPAMTSVVDYANTTLIPRFQEVIDIVGPKIAAALDTAAPAFERVADKAGPLLDKLVTMGTDALPGVLEGFDDIVEHAPEWVDAFAWANDPDAQPAKFLNDLQDNLQSASQAIRDFLGDTNDNGIWDDFLGIRQYEESQKKLDEKLAAGGFGAGQTYTDALGNSIDVGAANTSTAVQAMIDKAIADGKLRAGNSTSIGTDLVNGAIVGLNNRAPALYASIGQIGDKMIAKMRAKLDSHSPSRVMESISNDAVDGLIIPTQKRRDEVARSYQNLVTIPTVSLPTTSVASNAGRPVTIDPTQFRELLETFKVELMTDDVVLASSAGRGSGFQSALGAS